MMWRLTYSQVFCFDGVEVMECLETFFEWDDFFEPYLHSISLFFSNLSRCNRFSKICIKENKRIQARNLQGGLSGKPKILSLMGIESLILMLDKQLQLSSFVGRQDSVCGLVSCQDEGLRNSFIAMFQSTCPVLYNKRWQYVLLA